MRQRSLFEFNHDFAEGIFRDRGAFIVALTGYLSSGDAEAAKELERFGLRFFSRRHHSDPFSIKWGFNDAVTERGS